MIIDEVIPALVGVSTTSFCNTTLTRYMHEWGYMYRKNRKAIYFDGHERDDVVQYRIEWSKRMVEYMQRMEFFTGEKEELTLQPNLKPGLKKIVLVTHDESTFYTNDGKEDMWLKDGENMIRKKGAGMSIMVSEFQCPCHGTMRMMSWTSRKLFKAGLGREGW
jgi:hypothetical protein